MFITHKIAVAQVSAFFCTGPLAPISTGQPEEGQVTPAQAVGCITEEELSG